MAVTCWPSTDQIVSVDAIERLMFSTIAKHIILLYRGGGRATAEELREVMNRVGALREWVEIDYRRNLMAKMRWPNEWDREAKEKNKESLFLVEKSKYR